ncbi:Scr1 family TA system antitoxin-like transcriptional regulator [Sphaerisporangium aureirubrum]|uniref:Scr1 family TA system antitoxin-like transcriptional regulator n=1 Tax=Sphaerisporangium aureirubrum TaxID=1544736 RepID=A0ABW1NFY8_9ACTN
MCHPPVQFRHFIEMAVRPAVTIQIVPNRVGAHPALTGAAFVILDFPSPDPSLVYLATATDSLWLEKPEEYQRYTLIYSQEQASSALSPDDSVHYLAAMVDQLKR